MPTREGRTAPAAATSLTESSSNIPPKADENALTAASDSSGLKTASESADGVSKPAHSYLLNPEYPLAAAAKKLWGKDTKATTDAKGTSQSLKKGKKSGGAEEVTKEAQDLMTLFQAPQGMVEVTIPSGKTFHLHIDVLCDKSGYFHAALTGGFAETASKKLALTDVSDNTFAFFLKWLYGGSIQPDLSQTPIPKTCPVHREATMTWSGLIELWFFADYLCTPALQNHVVDNIVYKMNNYYSHVNDDRFKQVTDAVKTLWQPKARTDLAQLPSAKPLLNLLIDFVANPVFVPKDQATKMVKVMPASFIREYALRTVDRVFAIRDKTENLIQLARLHGHFCDCGCDGDESDFEDIFEKLDLAEMNAQEINDTWKIDVENYYVKETKKGEKK